MHSKIGTLILWLCFFSTVANAQFTLPIVPSSYGLKNGLADNNVIDGLFDDQDLLWLGTTNGLSCFDGHQFLNYNVTDSIYRLSDNTVNSVARIGQYIYAATPKGIDRIHSRIKSSQVFYHAVNSENYVTLYATQGGHLIGISAKGVCRNFMTGKQLILPFQATEYFVAGDGKGHLYISSFQKDYCSIDLAKHTQISFVQKTDNPNYGLVYKKDVGLLSLNYKGVYKNNLSTKQEELFLPVQNIVNGLTEIDKDHFLTLHDFNKIMYHNAVSGSAYEIQLLQTRNAIYKKLLVDRFGIAILLTNTGIYSFKLPLEFQSTVPDLNLLDQDMVMVRRSMLEYKEGKIALLSYRGIQLYDPASNQTTILTDKPLVYYTALLQGSQLWIGTDGKGLLRFDMASNKIAEPVKTNLGLKDEHIFSIAGTPEGKLLLGYFIPFGLREYDPITKSMSDIDFGYGNIVPAQSRISHISLDSSGHYWIATDKGLVELNADKKALFRYDAVNGNPDQQLPASGANYVLHISGSKLWVATDNGIALVNTAARRVEKVIGVKQNLAGEKCVSILSDKFNRIWISSYKGLSCYIPETDEVYNFYKEDGLPDDEYNYMASLSASNGDLYFGGLNGIVRIQPGKWDRSKEVPRLSILQILRENESQKIELFDEETIRTGIRLTRSKEVLDFRFGFREYINSGYCKYWYRIKGLDDKWIYLANIGHLRLWNLPAGNYTLEIRGANAKGTDAPEIISIPLEIVLPFYQSTVFKGLLIVLVIGLISLFLYQRYRSQQAIRSIKSAMLNDIHDEVGSILTKTAMKAELLNIKLGSQVAELRDIQQYSREAIQSLRNLLWSISSEKMSTQTFQDRIVDWLHFFFSDTGYEVAFQNKIPDEVFIDSVLIRRNIILIIKELAHNTLKHANGTEFTILLDKYEGKFRFLISDNGVHSDGAISEKGYGLNSIRQRVSAIKGTVEFQKRSDGFYTEIKF